MTPSTRKFYRTVLTVEVLSEEPLGDVFGLEDLASRVSTGDCSGDYKVSTEEILNGPAMAKALIAQHSDPEFFGLTEDGEETGG
jgi:hypothetical protein